MPFAFQNADHCRKACPGLGLAWLIGVLLCLAPNGRALGQTPGLGESTLPRQAGAAARPNILLLVADDLRWNALGFMGNDVIKSPRLDALAARGVIFENAFCTTAICCTSRATLLTGQYARRHGIWDFKTDLSADAWATSFPAVMRAHGYRTGFVGKWGVGNNLPADQYDYWAGYPGQGQYYTPGNAEHLTDTLARQALEFLDGCSNDQPFCLQVSFKCPHVQDDGVRPYAPAARCEDLHADQQIPLPPLCTEEARQALPECLQTGEGYIRWKLRFGNPELHQQSLRDYYRLVAQMDEVIGQMLDQIDAKGWRSNTVVLFTSDNGYFLGDRMLEGKWNMYEQSIRIPMLLVDPRLPADRQGLRMARTVLSVDVAPTLLEASGLAIPPVMQGTPLGSLAHKNDFKDHGPWLYEHLFKHAKIPPVEGVRGDRYKYARYGQGESLVEQLFDLQNDPQELHNLIAAPAQADVLAQMRAHWQHLVRQAE